jgi:hypothetical protein
VTRERWRRPVLVAGALLALALAAWLAVMAVDVARWRDALAAGDVRYHAASADTNLWSASTLTSAGVSRALLGVGEDVEFRRAIRAVRDARLEERTVSDPMVALRRNEAIGRLEAIVANTDLDRFRRSRAAGLLGVLGLSRLYTETQDPEAVLQATVASLRLALLLDPENDEAKFNLELALTRGRAMQLAEAGGGANPSPGGSGARGAGAGDPGTGY